ncbi:MAG: M1 family metallopeptidase, partial [Bacteroidota bacterium]
MLRTAISLLLLVIGHYLPAQTYFQQEVNHRIDVVLDDEKHTLEGGSTITYINNSPDTLTKFFFHLWPNAHQDNTTALARQLLRYGRTSFHFATDEQRGGFENIAFQVDDKTLQFAAWKGHPDVIELKLEEPISPGASLEINIAFLLKIPESFSRLGHVGQTYQMTQWYPKPAVYDQEGWHPMPYLDNGEFYSEFGSFDVNISLPANYIVAATGVLQNEDELSFLETKILETNALLKKPSIDTMSSKTPSSNTQLKTLQFKANQVHDFAWFADKDFLVQRSKVTIPNGEEVDTWAYFTVEEVEKWQYATDYLDRSVLFFSREVGDYPYPHATAVLNTESAGGGMEYPMITLIGKEWSYRALDQVITHEVGHNWFYGILGFNERDEGWLDEGLTMYYEQRYIKQFYGQQSNNFFVDGPLLGKSKFNTTQTIQLYQEATGNDQAIATTSDSLNTTNYWLNYYDLPQLWWEYLAAYLGQDSADQMIQEFFEQWQFKHPSGKDVQAFFEQSSAKDLSWLFDDLFRKNEKIDYAIKTSTSDEEQVKVVLENKGSVPAPFPLAVVDKSGNDS